MTSLFGCSGSHMSKHNHVGSAITIISLFVVNACFSEWPVFGSRIVVLQFMEQLTRKQQLRLFDIRLFNVGITSLALLIFPYKQLPGLDAKRNNRLSKNRFSGRS